MTELTKRQRAIATQLEERGFLSTTQLAVSFDVSDMTIRRDARALAKAGAARVVHGGLMLPHGTRHTAGFAQRASEDADAKQRIAQACVDMVAPGQRILVDAGTTPFAIAQALPPEFGGTVITHSAPVIQLALNLREATTIALGGELLIDSQAFIGGMTIQNMSRLRAEIAFIGAAGVTAQGAFIERNLEMPTKLAIMDATDRVVLVATSAKMGSSSLVHLCAFDAIDALVTDAPPPEEIREALDAAGVETIIAV